MDSDEEEKEEKEAQYKKKRMKGVLSRLEGSSKNSKTSKNQMTALCWKIGETDESGERQLISCSSAGNIYNWKPVSEEILYHIKEDNQIFCTDYSHFSKRFATAGGDYRIRIYDDNTQEVSQTFFGAEDDILGHANRVFSVKFHPKDPNILISGGWDNLIYIWDLRQEGPVSHILGPNISGEAMDISGDYIVAGSYNNEQNLYLMSLKNSKIVKNLEWYDSERYKGMTLTPPCIYAAQFTKPNSKYIIAGGISRNEVRIFKNIDNFTEFKGVASVSNLQSGCIALDCMHTNENKFAIGCANGTMKCLRIQEPELI